MGAYWAENASTHVMLASCGEWMGSIDKSYVTKAVASLSIKIFLVAQIVGFLGDNEARAKHRKYSNGVVSF